MERFWSAKWPYFDNVCRSFGCAEATWTFSSSHRSRSARTARLRRQCACVERMTWLATACEAIRRQPGLIAHSENFMSEHKVIITCAVTGSIHTPSMSPYLPVTAEEIADAAIGAAAAGAAIVHLHARNPVDGRPDQSPAAFEPFLREIKRVSDVVVNLTTGGSPFMSVEERVRPAAVWKPEVASLNMGSMNFGLFPMLRRYKEFKHAWEPQM